MRVACIKVVTVRTIEIYREVTGWQNQQGMDKYAHRRYRRSRIKDSTI